MKHILAFVASCLFIASGAFAKGHGGGHGGGGGHHSGGHSSSRSSNVHSAGSSNSQGVKHAAGHSASQTKARVPVSRTTAPSAIVANHARNMQPYQKGVPVQPRGGEPVVVNPGTAYYPSYYYGYYDPYYANPYAYNPYFNMWSMGFSMMYSPTYPYMGAGSGNSYNNGYSNNNMEDDLEGYAVYAHDTISGALTLKTNAILLATKDSGKDYDYTFKIKDKELEYVTAFNSEDKQVKLVRLEKSKKKLWRVVHEGKLNLYDYSHGFIYRPGDIDRMSLMAAFNGDTKTFYSVKNKEQLIDYVNQAYGLQLDPKNFTWNQLLIYVDKLD